MTSSSLVLPDEVQESIEEFDQSLESVEDILKPMLSVPLQDIKDKLDPLQCAKCDLTMAYAINSLFWIYLTTRGVNPKDHQIKDELDRIKKYMGKLKEISDRKNATKLDKGAAQRFVRNALWKEEKGKEKDGRKGPNGPKRKGSSKYRVDNRKKKAKQD